MDTLNFIAQKYNLDLNSKSQIDINMTRLELAELFAELGFAKGAEIGVERGIFSEILCKANPNLTLYSIDPWLAYPEFREHTTQEKIDEFYEEAIKRLAPYSAQIIRATSEQAVKMFADEVLDFVYIDANHTAPFVWQDLSLWVPKVKAGGIVSGHDFVEYKGEYGRYNKVKEAVKRYVDKYRIAPLFALRSTSERTSWMWVKDYKEPSYSIES